MTLTDGLNYSILALDSYNRGYNPGVELNGSTISGLTILPREAVGIDDPSYAAWQAANFYAAAYQDLSGNIVISYRGTDDPASDSVGWSGGAGFQTAQAELAAKFYYQVKQAYPGATITLTGHSLGGGLAGLIAKMTGSSNRRVGATHAYWAKVSH